MLRVILAGFTVGVVAMAAEPAPSSVTFAKDVARIFQEKCNECHRLGTAAPMALETYEQARPWARSIKQRISMRQMPP